MVLCSVFNPYTPGLHVLLNLEHRFTGIVLLMLMDMDQARGCMGSAPRGVCLGRTGTPDTGCLQDVGLFVGLLQ